jgi:DNA-3-methyladenine glycosylase II
LQARNGTPRLRTRPGGLEGLAWIVTGQLISAQAAQAIWQRVRELLHPFEAGQIALMPPEAIAGAGLTRAKAACIVGAAKAVREGSFSFEALRAWTMMLPAGS